MTYHDVVEAYEKLSPVVHRTPFEHSKTFSQLCGCEVYLKLENLQKTGAFKIRGAFNKISSLTDEERARGVITASAGNHAQGVALSASLYHVPSIVVMPEGAPYAKIEATEGYGSQVVLHGGTYDEAYQKAMEIAQERGMTFVHAFNDPHVIAGQGTIGLEMFKEMDDLDAVVVPIGGGGLISGVAVALKALNPSIRVVGVQPEGAASTYYSLQSGQKVELQSIQTIADGLAVKTPGEIPLALIRQHVDEVVTVSDQEIIQTMWLLLERSKLLVEGAGAAALTALRVHRCAFDGKKVGVLVSGGNMDIRKLLSFTQENGDLALTPSR